MEPSVPHIRYSLPRHCRNKRGEPVRVQLLREALHPSLVKMYLDFRPRNSFQGLPPMRDEVCVNWVQGMVGTAVNLVALGHDEALVGHAALFPIDGRKCEMLVVVSPESQNLGIGTELVQACGDVSRELGYRQIWLPVEATNVRARHVYRKCGFQYASARQSRELDMTLELGQLPTLAAGYRLDRQEKNRPAGPPSAGIRPGDHLLMVPRPDLTPGDPRTVPVFAGMHPCK